MTHLSVIRHAQPEGRKPEIIGLSPPDSGLSPVGINQAERLRDRLATTNDLQVDVLISSPMRRARETAEILAPLAGCPRADRRRGPGAPSGSLRGINLGRDRSALRPSIGERTSPFAALPQMRTVPPPLPCEPVRDSTGSPVSMRAKPSSLWLTRQLSR
jgi:Histidine phosphatase superfamily (branch 1)